MSTTIQFTPDVPGVTTFQASVVTRFFKAGAAIAAGDAVAIDWTTTTYGAGMTVRKADTANTGDFPVGGALNAAAAAGDDVEVVVGGYQASVNALSTNLAAGDRLMCSSTAGRLVEWADGGGSATSPVSIVSTTVALVVSNVSSNVWNVFWVNPLNLSGLTKAGG